MQIGITIGAIFGVILTLAGGISLLITRKKNPKVRWPWWMLIGGICALITAGHNAIQFLL